jgi:hypothetical protein
MEVNFNDLRRSTIHNYNRLVEKASNVDIIPEEAYDEIRSILQDLRENVVFLACCYDKEAGIVSLANEKILVVP